MTILDRSSRLEIRALRVVRLRRRSSKSHFSSDYSDSSYPSTDWISSSIFSILSLTALHSASMSFSLSSSDLPLWMILRFLLLPALPCQASSTLSLSSWFSWPVSTKVILAYVFQVFLLDPRDRPSRPFQIIVVFLWFLTFTSFLLFRALW